MRYSTVRMDLQTTMLSERELTQKSAYSFLYYILSYIYKWYNIYSIIQLSWKFRTGKTNVQRKISGMVKAKFLARDKRELTVGL